MWGDKHHGQKMSGALPSLSHVFLVRWLPKHWDSYMCGESERGMLKLSAPQSRDGNI